MDEKPVFGWVRVRYTSADLPGRLRTLAGNCRLLDVVSVSLLTAEFTVSLRDGEQVRRFGEKQGDEVIIIARGGLIPALGFWQRMPVISVTLCLLLLATIWIPRRIFFIRVEGNTSIATGRILEQAEQCGLYFGCSREALRSEQVKNRLLEAMPELSWAGVNTAGCVATITVRERKLQEDAAEDFPGNIVAATDAVITEMLVHAGTPLCKPGDAVQAGQILISGYTDLGLCTHVEAAEGEVYGRTIRRIRSVLPRKTLIALDSGQQIQKYSMIFGKKRINFYSDSGILYTGCGKMTQIRYLQLPGGWVLPVAFVVETYSIREFAPEERWEPESREMLEQGSQTHLRRQMIAGQILGKESSFSSEGGVYCLNTLYECREMIGRRSSGIRTEGDTKDDGENRER